MRVIDGIKKGIFGGSERYLLRDDFSDIRAAGAVNGTLAIPGPGTRNLLDTSAVVTIGNGVMAITGGGIAGSWDPLYDLDAITRKPGRFVIGKYIKSTNNTYIRLGWSVTRGNPSSRPYDVYPYGSTEVRVYISASNSFTIDSALPLGSTYLFAIALRATGAFLFANRGSGWILLCISDLINTVTVYPSVMAYQSSDAAKVDFIRVPINLLLPNPLASDGFLVLTLTDGLGHAEGVAGGLGSGGGGIAWATAVTWAVGAGVTTNTPVQGAELAAGNLTVGTWYAITATQADHFYVGCAVGDHFRATAATALDANNKVKPFTLAELFRSLDSAFTPSVIAQLMNVAATSKTSRGIAIRLDDPDTPTQGIVARFDGFGNISVDEFSAGTWTQLFTAAKAFSANDQLQLIADGANVRLIHITAAGAATLIGSTAAATITTGGYHGLFSTDPGNQLDDFRLWARGTGGEYNMLNRWSN